ncbi:c-type cytochrome [Parathalassolituus penaei]|uniref:Cytochrome c n=1 Tax=Parathalassolituus penaei TaxID=2997323 RepID=A0A9X3EDQ6_9GAMM|nr:cytochrome c [Parathalassolituus penaei]MCY0964825.1 cytochrome c [Parathalassolituus penaei]
MNNRMLKSTLGKIACLTLATAVIPAAWAFKDADEAIEYRQSAFVLIGEQVSQMGAMIRNEKPFDAAEFKYRADSVAALSLMPLEGFMYPGSDKGETKAKPEIWENTEDFSKRLKTFQDQAAALSKAAAGGDLAAAKPAFMDVMKNCKSCHTDYKNR